MPNKIFTPAILAFSLILLPTAGGAAKYSFKVDAINNPNFPIENGTSFRIVDANPKIGRDTARFQKVSQYVKTILDGKGYYEAPNRKKADLIVEVAFGTKSPRLEYEVRPGAPPSATSGIYGGRGRGLYPYPGGISIGGRNGGYDEIVGTEDEIIPKTINEKYLMITAREKEPKGSAKAGVQAWSVTVINQDESDDLDSYLPIMAAAAIPYIDKKTEGREKVVLKDSDEDVRYVLKGL